VQIGDYLLQVVDDDPPAEPTADAGSFNAGAANDGRWSPRRHRHLHRRSHPANASWRGRSSCRWTWPSRAKLHASLVKQMDLRRLDVRSMDDESRNATIGLIDEVMQREFSELPKTINPRRLAKEVLDEAIGLARWKT
jgi:pilus assembly protein CpaF